MLNFVLRQAFPFPSYSCAVRIMNESRSTQPYSEQFLKMCDAQRPSLRIEELTQLARHLAIAAVKARRSAVSGSTASQDITFSEDDPTYQAWFRYFLQLQLQDSQIRKELVQRTSLANSAAETQTSTAYFSRLGVGQSVTSTGALSLFSRVGLVN